jgi:hypothetical protein
MKKRPDQPSCSVLPNTGPKPLRPSLSSHLVASSERASPQFNVFVALFVRA